MPRTTKQNVFIVEAYFRHKSIRKAQFQFEKQFRCHEFASHTMMYKWVHGYNKFRTHGTVHNLNHKDANLIITPWTT